MMREGVLYGFTSPAGRGLGATTLAASKYGEKTINAEVDFANLMLSLGLLGGLLYAAIVVVVLMKALRWWTTERHTLALVTLGILVVTLGSWLIGGEYSATALIWFVIGSMDRLSTEEQAQRYRSPRLAAGHHHA
jgi:Na+-driven multidrug efflux pump